MKRIAVAIVVACSAVASLPVEAYKETTHALLTSWVAYRSKLQTDATLLSDLGLQPWAIPQLPDPINGGMQTVSGLMQLGAVHEDDLSPIGRPANHFYDHQWQNFQGRGLSGVLFGQPSPAWALEYNGNVLQLQPPGAGEEQVFSYRQAQDAYWSGLTASDAATRSASFAAVFKTLGHVVHHLEDMSQPEHTRNDRHLPGTEFYEWYSQDHEGSIDSIVQGTLNQYSIPTLSDVRLFFASSGGPFFVGMAEFTGQNYASIDTGLSVTRTSAGYTVGPNAEFPRPNGVNHDGTLMQAVSVPVSVVLDDGFSTVNGYIDTITGDVFDGYYNRTIADQKLGMSSGVWSREGQAQLAVLSAPMWDEQHWVLWPRAVAFSAGLVNHFFRGRVNLARAPNGTDWAITNTSVVALNGTFTVYAENSTTGARQPVAGAQFARNLAPAQSSTVTFPEPPAGTSKLVLAFRGQAGAEVPPDPGFAAVAGKVINYTVPPANCAGITKRSGGVGGVDTVRELGSTQANVQLEFEAYSIPDGLTVKSENSAQTQLATTNGLVSGRRTWTIAYNPNNLGSTRVRIQVNAPDPNTQWNLTMGCPGQTISNGDRDYPLVNTTFRFGGSLSGASGSCVADVWIDGQYRFTANVIANQTPAVRTTQLSKGVGHGLEYRNYSCSNANNITVGANFTDSVAGHTHSLPAMNMTGTIHIFDVH